ncbi:MAG: O-acetyl-ADP-ribose deacetylase [Chloroflexi bacterium]|nr:O-acetyl-ADP-ribose deacetylase [Chloroflexota bacterium]
MRVHINQAAIELVQGDITEQDTQAIVNAANTTLLGGGGVDGAIHRAAGPRLLRETSTLGGCATGDAKISGGYRLKADHVIHAVGPVYRKDDPDVARLLASAHRRSLEVALEHGVSTVAFPAISTGVYGYPLHEAAPIALGTTADFLRDHPQITLVRFVLFDQRALAAFEAALADLSRSDPNVQPD